MKRIFTQVILAMLLCSQAAAFGLWGDAGLGLGASVGVLPGASSQTLFLGMESSTSPATFTRSTVAWSPQSGASTAIDTGRFVTGKAGSGLLIERAATNLLTYSNTWDNAAWALSSIDTPVKNQTDPWEVANNAYTLTATGANGTILQTVTSASAIRTFSVYMKRLTGTGNIDLTYNNGTTWTTKTLTSSWQRFTITLAAVTNPVAGIRIVTSGDAIAVYQADLVSADYETSFIPTTTAAVTRAYDLLQHTTSGIIAAPGTVQGWWKPSSVASGTVQTLWSTGTAADGTHIQFNGVSLYAVKAKTEQTTEYAVIVPGTTAGTSAIAAGTFYHVALAINADGTMSLYLNGVPDPKTAGTDADGLGAELYLDPSFDDASKWTAGTGWDVNVTTPGSATASASSLSTLFATVAIPRKVYLATTNCTSHSGGSSRFQLYIGTVQGPQISTTGTTSFAAVADAGTNNGLRGISSFSGAFNSISQKEIYNSTSTTFAPVIHATAQNLGSLGSGTLVGAGTYDNWRWFSTALTQQQIQTYVNKSK